MKIVNAVLLPHNQSGKPLLVKNKQTNKQTKKQKQFTFAPYFTTILHKHTPNYNNKLVCISRLHTQGHERKRFFLFIYYLILLSIMKFLQFLNISSTSTIWCTFYQLIKNMLSLLHICTRGILHLTEGHCHI